ncbi:MauE/DoxX family redox-associated membrane protein [Arthrobacter sp. AZCC_0090]|uniref:MauE/DoxX family redox-associated membrane protein n=1 Tax=Arthrobacter sp. AZCC_0090 TaxID=2735881 RepID=UPI001607971D
MDLIGVAGGTIIATVFSIAAIGKLSKAGFETFVAATVRFIPSKLTPFGRLVAKAVLTTEFAIIASQFTPFRSTALFFAAALLGAFTIGIGLALGRGDTAPCACFGADNKSIGAAQLARNLALMAICAIGASGSLLQVSPIIDMPTALITILAFSAGSLIAVRFDDVKSIFAR